jgi:hypothetical protein
MNYGDPKLCQPLYSSKDHREAIQKDALQQQSEQ